MIQNRELKEWYQTHKQDTHCELVKILGVEYAHIKLRNHEDIYVTAIGLPYVEILKPDNFWTDKEWFDQNSEKLSGTSSVYKVRTKAIKGQYLDIVFKWNRMGQEIPGYGDSEALMCAEFNSPFEEFSLVFELRKSMRSFTKNVFIQNPLAIFVPSEPLELWQVGRKEYKMKPKIDSHEEIALDMFRSYAVMYEWIPGMDVNQAFCKKIFEEDYANALTIEAMKIMETNGFVVKDHKPQHVIVNPNTDGALITEKSGGAAFSIIDFELLERTRDNEEKVKKDKRLEYLRRQKDRFQIELLPKFHPYLHDVNIFNVDYVYGHVESTKGRLWVLGRDPFLYDYFLPERWENIPKTKISVFNKMYYTVTKDDIHLAWKSSKVGVVPDMDPFKEEEKNILDYGYNSPFEEAAIAIELSRKGIPTIYPRAVYMSSTETEISENLRDNSRYENPKV